MALWTLSGLLKGTVEEEDDDDWEARSTVRWSSDVVVASVDGKNMGTASAIDGDNGSNCFFSLIEMTIFSSPADVICF